MFYLTALITSYVAFALIACVLNPFSMNRAPIKQRRCVVGRVVGLVMLFAGLCSAAFGDYNALNSVTTLLLTIGSTAILLVLALLQYRRMTKDPLSHLFR